jgi:NTE family protein
MERYVSVACWLALLGSPAVGLSQERDSTSGTSEPPARPRVGLVLSGGGARGGAHIGVIKALEELRVPIDYIAGTSIGAVVGGLYAAGTSVAELEEVVDSIDWDSAFRNVTPRPLRSFRRKRDDDLFLVNQKPGLNDGQFDLPIGFVQGQVMDLILSRLTLPTAQVAEFDELAIPFRAVATDVATGEAVALGSGDLARALRASMSVPAAITPIEIDGRLLVDGGIAMNLPVEVARAMGADVIIAVDISTPLRSREQIRSVVDVTTQLTNLLTRQNVLAQREFLSESDVLLEPRFSDEQTTVSFARMAETVDVGYGIAREAAPVLERFALDPAEYAAYAAARPDPRVIDPPVIDFVRLNNESGVADSVIEARLRDIQLGEPLDLDAIERAVTRVYGLEFYENVRYDLVVENGRTGLEVDLEERSWGPNYLQLGIEYNSSGDQNALFALAASYLSTTVNRLGGEWRATFIVGDEPAFLVDFHQPLGTAGMFFVAPALNIEQRLFSVFEEERLIAELEVDQRLFELAAGRELGSWGEIRAGLRSADGDGRVKVGDFPIPNDEFRKGEVFVRLSADTMDSISFPRSGTLTTIEWLTSDEDALSADVDFDQALVNAAYAQTWGRHTVLSTLRYETTINGQAPVASMFRLGGLFDLSGLNRDQLFGQHLIRVGAAYYRRIGDLALFPAFAGFTVELGNVWEERSEMSFGDGILGGSLWAGVDTPVGPIYVAYGATEGGQDSFYVFLGRPF